MISILEGKNGPAKKPAERVFDLRFTVVGCTPRIWRRFQVRETMWLSKLHDCIQLSFEWFDYQTHVFTIGDAHFGNPMRRDPLVVEDDRDISLAELDFGSRERVQYVYNFGDGWEVEIKVEGTHPVAKGAHYPICVAGERAGPPEDCGGVEAFHDMLACIKEPNTELGREWLEWLGPGYDPEAIDLEKVNKNLRKLAK